MQISKISQSFPVGAALSIVGGFLDAYTYLIRGRVFANAQTGNIVLLGIRLAEGKWKETLFCLAPVVAFILGVLVAEAVRQYLPRIRAIHWRQTIILCELMLLLLIAFCKSGTFDLYINIIVSFVCSLQVETFRMLSGNAYATTMCTGNLRSGTEALYRYFYHQNPADKKLFLQYSGIIAFFIIGAVLGTVLTMVMLEKSILFCCIVLLMIFLTLFLEESSC